MILRRSQRGFTLLELLMVVAVILILVGFAARGLVGGGQPQQLSAAGNRVADLIHLARQTAKSRNSMSMLVVAIKGDQAYRAFTILEKTLEATEWKQIAPWEILPDGVVLSEAGSDRFITQPVASLSPAPPALSLRGRALPSDDYAWQVFLPNGSLLTDQSNPPALDLTPASHTGTAANYYRIIINRNTGIPTIRRP